MRKALLHCCEESIASLESIAPLACTSLSLSISIQLSISSEHIFTSAHVPPSQIPEYTLGKVETDKDWVTVVQQNWPPIVVGTLLLRFPWHSEEDVSKARGDAGVVRARQHVACRQTLQRVPPHSFSSAHGTLATGGSSPPKLC